MGQDGGRFRKTIMAQRERVALHIALIDEIIYGHLAARVTDTPALCVRDPVAINGTKEAKALPPLPPIGYASNGVVTRIWLLPLSSCLLGFPLATSVNTSFILLRTAGQWWTSTKNTAPRLDMNCDRWIATVRSLSPLPDSQ